MRLRAAYPLLAGAALLGAVVGYVEITRTIAQPTNGGAGSGAADAARAAAPPAPTAAASAPPSGNPLSPEQPAATTHARNDTDPTTR